MRKFIYILLFAALTMTSCYTYRDRELLQTRSDLPQYDSVAFREYRLRPNDQIIFRIISLNESAKIFGELASNTMSMAGSTAVSYRIYEDGTIDIPYVKGIKIGGSTLHEAEDEMERRIREILPDAAVKMALYNNSFSTLGDIRNGTYYIYRERMNIFQALAQTGLVPVIGDKKHIKILRQMPDGKSQIIEFDIRPRSIINSEYYYVYPNDVIYVRRDPHSFYKFNATFAASLGVVTSAFNFLATILLFGKE